MDLVNGRAFVSLSTGDSTNRAYAKKPPLRPNSKDVTPFCPNFKGGQSCILWAKFHSISTDVTPDYPLL